MIPRSQITAWRSAGHPWQTDAMVEQDLIISAMVVTLFRDEVGARGLVLQFGTRF
jgi:hypothetical protein